MNKRFKALSPVSGYLISEIQQSGEDEVISSVQAARKAQANWRDTPIEKRLGYVKKLRALIVSRIDKTTQQISEATGKPQVEALASDILICVELMHYYEENSAKILAVKNRKSSLIYRPYKFSVQWEPFGVVAVISPWNHPLQLSLVPVISALIAGNTVVLKPSELTPTIGLMLERWFNEIGLPKNVFKLVQGGGEVGKKLIEAGPDKIFFTGSVTTGKAIMKAASEKLIPVSLELGGKDAMIVFSDANLKRAVMGAVYGALAHAGQNCVAVERIYAQREIYKTLVNDITAQLKTLKIGSGVNADFGPVMSEAQIKIIEEHLQEAIEKGAKASGELSRKGNFLQPVVLTDVNHDMKVMREETFGPIIPVMPFSDEEEAVKLANDSDYGLGASVWTQDTERARRVANKLNVGNCAVNDTIKNIGNPTTPFGGVKLSGFGRSHGPEGLKAFCRSKSVMVNSQLFSRELNWFPYSSKTYEALKTVIYSLHGEDSSLNKVVTVGRSVKDAIRGSIWGKNQRESNENKKG